jgi:hypothetical protein
MIKTLADIPTPAGRVRRIEFVRETLREDGAEIAPDLPLSSPSAIWLERIQAALVDETVSKASFAEIKNAFLAYLMTLSALEAEELYRRVREFDLLKLAVIEACQ